MTATRRARSGRPAGDHEYGPWGRGGLSRFVRREQIGLVSTMKGLHTGSTLHSLCIPISISTLVLDLKRLR